ncbi:hypothetical protein [Falsigemmobacter faecalis]|uniref:Uncharacterized protein n=1 Tax=Falsigemmobacter faecalis TaxID=2488730 RepID=A0A3P3D6K8_9RHOB|nr:hypothetical protein [Falsigemmobacter faecalis]RRH70020.1 hypothetical protein EG244_17575 [Falsigemmobacter faecalis]
MSDAAEFQDIERWFCEQGEAAALSQLVRLTLRRMREEAAAFLDAGIAWLEGEQARDQKRGAEADRLRQILDQATPPEGMQAAPVAPARGIMQRVDDPAGPYWRGADQLSVMCRQARARHKGDAAFVAPFTPGQIAMGRHYQALVERHDSAGMKCASLEGRGGGGSGGGGGFIEAVLRDRDEIRALYERIGSGIALQVRRATDAGRRPITVRRLVDAVCLEEQDITAVLRAHGWGKDSALRQTLRKVLADALDRMQGYPPKNSC